LTPSNQSPPNHSESNSEPKLEPKKRSLFNIAKVVAVATLLSKVFGLLRQVAIAAAFGNGSVYGAYNFAYVIPGFLLILLGGINGPFHSAIVSVLAKNDSDNPKEIAPIMETITTLVIGILLVLTLGIIIFAEPLMHLTAPGLFMAESEMRAKGMDLVAIANLKLTREVAIQQLQIMAPMTVLAGLIGIGFGALNAANAYWLPSVSPLFSSLTVLIGIGGLAFTLGNRILAPENALLGGAVLAWSTLAGAVLQWLVQIPTQLKSGMGGLRLRFEFQRPEVQAVIKIMAPATFSSGMLQINVWTDLFFASFIPNAAAAVSAMGYAGLLVQTPLGILSSVILVPLFPVLAKLTDPSDWEELKQRIRQGLMLTALAMLPLSALMIALALPISRLVYERGAFDREASQLTAAVLIAYGIGMFFYLARDILVRVFYALGDGNTPFKISIVNIFLNGLFDYFLVERFGAPGLVLATVAVNVISMFAMLWFLNRRLNGLPLGLWAREVSGLILVSAIAAISSFLTMRGLEQVLISSNFWLDLIELSLAAGVGIATFSILALQLRLPEVEQLVQSIRRKFLK
jgi:putative peptidoglycan lipid II flippase